MKKIPNYHSMNWKDITAQFNRQFEGQILPGCPDKRPNRSKASITTQKYRIQAIADITGVPMKASTSKSGRAKAKAEAEAEAEVEANREPEGRMKSPRGDSKTGGGGRTRGARIGGRKARGTNTVGRDGSSRDANRCNSRDNDAAVAMDAEEEFGDGLHATIEERATQASKKQGYQTRNTVRGEKSVPEDVRGLRNGCKALERRKSPPRRRMLRIRDMCN